MVETYLACTCTLMLIRPGPPAGSLPKAGWHRRACIFQSFYPYQLCVKCAPQQTKTNDTLACQTQEPHRWLECVQLSYDDEQCGFVSLQLHYRLAAQCSIVLCSAKTGDDFCQTHSFQTKIYLCGVFIGLRICLRQFGTHNTSMGNG